MHISLISDFIVFNSECRIVLNAFKSCRLSRAEYILCFLQNSLIYCKITIFPLLVPRQCKMSALQVFEDNYETLVTSLPMADAIFLAKIHSKRLLSGNIKATLKSLPTPADKATEFLDQVIEPSLKSNDVTPLKKLLTIMEDYGNDALKSLAKTIGSALDSGSSSAGNDKGEQKSDLYLV